MMAAVDAGLPDTARLALRRAALLRDVGAIATGGRIEDPLRRLGHTWSAPEPAPGRG